MCFWAQLCGSGQPDPEMDRPGLIHPRSSSSSSWFCNKTYNQKPAPVRKSASPSSPGTVRRQRGGDGSRPPVPAKIAVLFSCSYSIFSSFYCSTSERGPDRKIYNEPLQRRFTYAYSIPGKLLLQRILDRAPISVVILIFNVGWYWFSLLVSRFCSGK